MSAIHMTRTRKMKFSKLKSILHQKLASPSTPRIACRCPTQLEREKLRKKLAKSATKNSAVGGGVKTDRPLPEVGSGQLTMQKSPSEQTVAVSTPKLRRSSARRSVSKFSHQETQRRAMLMRTQSTLHSLSSGLQSPIERPNFYSSLQNQNKIGYNLGLTSQNSK